MKVLVACEESQAVCNRLRAMGVEAFSCDLLPCSGGHPEWHLQQDVLPLLREPWDMVIGFPPCTFLTVTGNRWFNVSRYGQKAIDRFKDQEKGIALFLAVLNANAPFVAVENPVGVMSSVCRKPDQIIQPWMFGDPFEKKTCLWLKGLPPLVPTDVVTVPPRKVYKSGKTMASWYADMFALPQEERSILRSKTFPGVADAMCSQWVSFVRDHVRLVNPFPSVGYLQLHLF